ncbi:unnamed protein product [Prunus brigantina]
MESFSSIVSLTYARRREASSPLQTSCFPKHELNRVFFERCVPDINSQAASRSTNSMEQAASRSTNSMESFSSIVSLTYARRRQASSPLQTSCFPKHELNGVFFEYFVTNICS